METISIARDWHAVWLMFVYVTQNVVGHEHFPSVCGERRQSFIFRNGWRRNYLGVRVRPFEQIIMHETRHVAERGHHYRRGSKTNGANSIIPGMHTDTIRSERLLQWGA